MSFKRKLKDSQQEVREEIMKYDDGNLHAATAFGKTVVCCDLIAKHQVNTLILVDHAERLFELLREKADRVIFLTGKDGTKGRRTQVAELNSVSEGRC